jgi:vancomycin permeability regulator SanA
MRSVNVMILGSARYSCENLQRRSFTNRVGPASSIKHLPCSRINRMMLRGGNGHQRSQSISLLADEDFR